MTEAATGQTQTDPGATQGEADPTTTSASAAPDQQQTQQAADPAAYGDQAENDKSAGEEGAKPDDKPADQSKTGAPEEYADFTSEDDVSIDTELSGELKAVAKELNLTQKQAQRIADLGAKQVRGIVAKQTEQLAAVREEWATQARADQEFGGEKFDENLGFAKKAIDTYATPELKKLLNDTGLGNHPEMIRAFVRAGKAISPDRFEGGRAPQGGAQRTAEDRLYGNTKSK